MHDALNRISSDLIDNATIVDNEAEILVDRLTTPEGATDVPVEEIDQDCNHVTSLQIGHCLLRFLLGAFLSVLTKLNLFAQLSVVCYAHLEVQAMVLKR